MQDKFLARSALASVVVAPGENSDSTVARWPHTLVVTLIFLGLAVAGFSSNRASVGGATAHSGVKRAAYANSLSTIRENDSTSRSASPKSNGIGGRIFTTL